MFDYIMYIALKYFVFNYRFVSLHSLEDNRILLPSSYAKSIDEESLKTFFY